ncbi:hypothetical protein A6A40_17220 (plasmid) [Azospirillum humicireducens]|uniref:Uncharacterized protein n=1 Tax=Azospirillum humicireducens TaxID=1226968 RepID=A0A2R4VQU7_9PROT|nr:hypothetical protein [Azospirillum humicireducens]AWB06795.1 hypothetical protein A6A40_17220 [Azospirillum humicireducens]
MRAADTVNLAVAAAATIRRLRRGEAVVGAFRAELVALLMGMVAVAAGRPAAQSEADAGEVIDLMVSLCRSAGMSGLDMAARFNEAVERRAR